MAQVIYTPRNYIQIYDQIEQFLVGSGTGLTNFNVGSRIRALAESFSIVSGQTHYDFRQALIEAIPVSLYDSLGFTRNPGLQSSGQIRIGLVEAPLVNTSVDIGRALNINGNDYITTTAGVILAGQNESDNITLQAVSPGVVFNLAIGDVDTREGKGFFADDSPFDYAYNVTAITGGTDQESNDERRARFITYINGLTKTTNFGIQSGLLNVATVRSVYIRELFPSPGWITIYVDDGSGTIPPSLLPEITKVVFGVPGDTDNFPGYKASGIRVSVEAPVLREFEVGFKIYIDISTLVTPAEIIAAAETAISAYLDSLRLGEDVFVTEMITAVQNSHPDILDVEILTMEVDGSPVPVENFTIAENEISKAIGFTSSYELISRS